MIISMLLTQAILELLLWAALPIVQGNPTPGTMTTSPDGTLHRTPTLSHAAAVELPDGTLAAVHAAQRTRNLLHPLFKRLGFTPTPSSSSSQCFRRTLYTNTTSPSSPNATDCAVVLAFTRAAAHDGYWTVTTADNAGAEYNDLVWYGTCALGINVEGGVAFPCDGWYLLGNADVAERVGYMMGAYQGANGTVGGEAHRVACNGRDGKGVCEVQMALYHF